MASASDTRKKPFFLRMKQFPAVIDGRINVVEFLDAVSDLIALVESLGKILAPVRYDMQGNIDKIKKNYKYDENSCLLELMHEEIENGKPIAAEGVLWLNRSLLFFKLVFQEILKCVKSNKLDTSMKKIFVIAYEGSVKQYHNWVNQQIFAFICKMAPTLSQVLKSVGADQDLKVFETYLTSFNDKVVKIISKIDNFFKEHKIIYLDGL